MSASLSLLSSVEVERLVRRLRDGSHGNQTSLEIAAAEIIEELQRKLVHAETSRAAWQALSAAAENTRSMATDETLELAAVLADSMGSANVGAAIRALKKKNPTYHLDSKERDVMSRTLLRGGVKRGWLKPK